MWRWRQSVDKDQTFLKLTDIGGEIDIAKREHEVDRGMCVFVFLNMGKTLACLGTGRTHL